MNGCRRSRQWKTLCTSSIFGNELIAASRNSSQARRFPMSKSNGASRSGENPLDGRSTSGPPRDRQLYRRRLSCRRRQLCRTDHSIQSIDWRHFPDLDESYRSIKILTSWNLSSATIESYTEFTAISSGSQPSPTQAEAYSENSRQPRGISTRQTLGSPQARTSGVTHEHHGY